VLVVKEAAANQHKRDYRELLQLVARERGPVRAPMMLAWMISTVAWLWLFIKCCLFVCLFARAVGRRRRENDPKEPIHLHTNKQGGESERASEKETTMGAGGKSEEAES
jgi:hypothetical protein